MFVKLHADGVPLLISAEKIALILPIKLSTADATQINFGDDFVNVDESFDEVVALVAPAKKEKSRKGGLVN